MKTSFRKTLLLSIPLVARMIFTPTYASDSNSGLSEATQGGIGCLVASSAAMAASLWAGPSETVMVAAGGLLVPSATTPLLVGLTATVVVASCGVGTAATPALLWFAEQIGITSGPQEDTTVDNQAVVTPNHPPVTNATK